VRAHRLLWLLPILLPFGASAQTDKAQDKREEIVIPGKKDKPLSEWEQMRAHDAQYRELKARFDPDLRQTDVDRDAADRDFAAPGGVHALQQERERPVAVDQQPPP
jgi:hypothetical protein